VNKLSADRPGRDSILNMFDFGLNESVLIEKEKSTTHMHMQAEMRVLRGPTSNSELSQERIGRLDILRAQLGQH
jgi:hypothetical protein